MATLFDILGATHIAVTSVTQVIGALKVQVDAYRSLPTLLSAAGQTATQIEQSISSLKSLAEVSTLESAFFVRTRSDVEDVLHELTAIQAEIANNSSVSRFAFASKLRGRLVGVNDQLRDIDRSLTAVGMIGHIVCRKLREECSSIRDGIDTYFEGLNAKLNCALKSSNPSLATEFILDIIRSNNTKSVDHSIRDGPLLDMLSSEREVHLFFLLGRGHYKGDLDGPKDFSRAARYLHAAYARGYSKAAFYLGKLYYNGSGVKMNYKASFGYYQVGAQCGDASAMSHLAELYLHGCGVDVNGRLAVKWANEAAEKGDGLGLSLAGYFALHGNATRRNYTKAVRYMKAALRAGEKRAGHELSFCFLNGIGVERDPNRAFDLLRETYESGGDESTIYFLANFCEVIEQDYVQAAKWYEELALLGTLRSRNYSCYWGYCLIRGLGVAKDVEAGLKIVRRSLVPGWASGWFILGDIFRYGHGVKRNMSKAVRFFSRATLCSGGVGGIVNSDLSLAELYEKGDGVEQSWKKAVHHYVRAANRMDRIAQWKAGSFFEAGIGVDVDVQRAFAFFESSARSGHVQAQRKAGELYMRGKGIERDRTKAIRWLQEASDRGDPTALALIRRAYLPNLLCWRKTKSD